MPRFAANLTLMFNEVGFLDRFEAAAKAGFSAVECQLPYAFPADEIAARLRPFDLPMVLHNLPAGDWDKGERGIAILPNRVVEFRDGVGKAIAYANALGCKQLNCLAGLAPQYLPPEVLRKTFVANLTFAAEALKAEGIRLLIEPINTIDIPGFFLTGTEQALEILDGVGSDNLFVQYDIYHMQIMEGDLARTVEANLPRIGHMQLADNPGRHEPGTGEINYPFLFRHIDRLGYDGWIGCEYKPATTTEQGLGWFASFAAKKGSS
jgi:hydroxypyruvate isomerase